MVEARPPEVRMSSAIEKTVGLTLAITVAAEIVLGIAAELLLFL